MIDFPKRHFDRILHRDQQETGILIGWHRQFLQNDMPTKIQADAQENNLLLMLEGEALKSREDRGV